jgi:hypothetical protein
MKPIKLFGLGAMMALMVMAFVGSSAAMAEFDTALCEVDPLEKPWEKLACPEGFLVEHVHGETLSGSPMILLTAVLNVECDTLFLGDVLTKGLLALAPEPLLISGKFTYTECNSSCTITEEKRTSPH